MIAYRRSRPMQLVLGLLLVGMLLAACGGGQPTPGSGQNATPSPAAGAPAASSGTAAPSEAEATAAVEATIQAGIVSVPEEGKENVTWWTHDNQAFVAANKEMIRRFEAENPGIHIVYQFFPYDIFINKLQTGYASGNEPDVQQMFGTWVTDYAKKGLLKSIDGVGTPDGIYAEIRAAIGKA